MITLSGVGKEYGRKSRIVGLDNINLEIAKAQMTAVVGPSGSGKSTLLHIIGLLDRPTTGRLEIDGVDPSGLSDVEVTKLRRDKIGFIFQFFQLLPALTALENVAIPLHLRGWSAKRAHERSRELLGLVRLGRRLSHFPDELSGGERQRVAIARALSVYPPILLGDEPTGNLDSETGAEILSLIHDVHERLGSTIVLVTHDASVAERCERVVSLRDGRLMEDRLVGSARSL